MTRVGILVAVAAVLAMVACGGNKGNVKGGGTTGTLGDTHATPPPNDDDKRAQVAPDAGAAPVVVVPPPKPTATFTFKNDSAKDELVFAIDNGWGNSVFAYTGKPPKAKSVLVFPKACTMSCDTAAADMCPVCELPDDPIERHKAEKENVKRQVIDKGASFSMDWDGKVYAYEKAPAEARGKNKKCECWRKFDPPADTYTVKACALRPTKKVGGNSTTQCVESTASLPFTGTGNEITLSFP